MYLHSAFEGQQIPALWVNEGTPGIRSQYGSNGLYTSHESVMVAIPGPSSAWSRSLHSL